MVVPRHKGQPCHVTNPSEDAGVGRLGESGVWDYHAMDTSWRRLLIIMLSKGLRQGVNGLWGFGSDAQRIVQKTFPPPRTDPSPQQVLLSRLGHTIIRGERKPGPGKVQSSTPLPSLTAIYTMSARTVLAQVCYTRNKQFKHNFQHQSSEICKLERDNLSQMCTFQLDLITALYESLCAVTPDRILQ